MNYNSSSHFIYIFLGFGLGGNKEEGVETGCRIEGTLFSPGSRNNSYSVKKQLRIKNIFKGKVDNSGGSLAGLGT